MELKMAAMSTVVTEFADNGNSRTYFYTGHTALKPKLVIQKRKVPSGKQVMLEDSVKNVVATTDPLSVIMAEKISFEVIVRRPTLALAADVTAALATIRDIVAGDEFAAMVTTQGWLKP
jgi:hypothetical protein